MTKKIITYSNYPTNYSGVDSTLKAIEKILESLEEGKNVLITIEEIEYIEES